MNSVTIDGLTFYELRIATIADYYEASPAGKEICFVTFKAMPLQFSSDAVEVSALFFAHIAEAFFSGRSLFVAFDPDDKHRARLEAVLPTIVPIRRERG